MKYDRIGRKGRETTTLAKKDIESSYVEDIDSSDGLIERGRNTSVFMLRASKQCHK